MASTSNAETASNGKYNILFTGYPPHHPIVAAQGWDTNKVAAGLSGSLTQMVEAGYNAGNLFWGPEEGMTCFEEELKKRTYHGVIVGFGVRGDPKLQSTIQFEQMVNILRTQAPQAVMMFNYNPTSTLEAVQRNFPLSKEESKKPGINYGENIVFKG